MGRSRQLIICFIGRSPYDESGRGPSRMSVPPGSKKMFARMPSGAVCESSGSGGVAGEGFDGRERTNCFTGLALGEAKFVETLQVEPEFSAGAEEMSQTQCGITGDGASSVDDLGNAVGGNPDL